MPCDSPEREMQHFWISVMVLPHGERERAPATTQNNNEISSPFPLTGSGEKQQNNTIN